MYMYPMNKLVYVQDRHSVEYLMLDCYKIDGNLKTRFGKKILKKKRCFML